MVCMMLLSKLNDLGRLYSLALSVDLFSVRLQYVYSLFTILLTRGRFGYHSLFTYIITYHKQTQACVHCVPA
jgi:hypothetical protein